jgi:antitoxin (DNA-binding transcriptional repressor) of toxin-antitoxin stability system
MIQIAIQDAATQLNQLVEAAIRGENVAIQSSNGTTVRLVPIDRAQDLADEFGHLSVPVMRNHDAFLNGYAPEDEGLYDDYPTR